MRKSCFVVFILFGLFSNVYSQTIPKNSLLINKAWWSKMSAKYSGFHGTQSRWISTGDFNRDGLSDLVLQFAAVGTSRMSWQDSLIDSKKFKAVFLNRGNNNFELDSNQVFDFKGGDDGHIVLDVNGDGFLDIYVCDAGSNIDAIRKSQLYINNGNNTFKENRPRLFV